jgi:hypothetical protein
MGRSFDNWVCSFLKMMFFGYKRVRGSLVYPSRVVQWRLFAFVTVLDARVMPFEAE